MNSNLPNFNSLMSCYAYAFKNIMYQKNTKQHNWLLIYLKALISHSCLCRGWRSHMRGNLLLHWGGSASRMEVFLKILCFLHQTSLCSTRAIASAESRGKGPRWDFFVGCCFEWNCVVSSVGVYENYFLHLKTFLSKLKWHPDHVPY